jgi:acyl-CoA thioesterase-1
MLPMKHIMLKRVLQALIALMLFALPAHAQQSTQKQEQMSAPLKIVVLGDNLLYGFQLKQEDDFSHQLEKFAKAYQYNVTVVNMCRISQTSHEGLYRLDEVLALKPHIVILELGYNDVLQGLSMGELNKNIHELLYHLGANGISPILVRADPPSSVRDSQKRLYDYLFAQMMQMHKVPYYNSLLEGVAGRADLTLDDKIHPNAKGVAVIVYKMFPVLEPIMRYRLKLREYLYRKENG